MNEARAIQIFEQAGAIVHGHFKYFSGMHGGVYVNKTMVYYFPSLISTLCDGIADRFSLDDIDVVVSPATGGIVLSQWVAYHLGERSCSDVGAIFTEKLSDGSGFCLRRGYEELILGRRILLVEDILTSGKTALQNVDLISKYGGVVVAVAALWNRGGVTAEAVGSPPELFSLINREFEAWDPQDCPHCRNGEVLSTQVGHASTPV